MRTRTALFAASLGLVLAAASAAAQGPGLYVDDFSGPARYFDYGAVAPLRRAVTSNVEIVKDLIDLVPFGSVSVSGGATISALSNGRTSAGKGYIQMRLSVPATLAVGSIVTLKVGLTDQFRFTAIHTGEVSRLETVPDPRTIEAGTPWVATVHGLDLGGIVVNQALIQCHAIEQLVRNDSLFRVRLTRAASCPATSYRFDVTGSAPGDPPSYAMSTGAGIGFGFSYAQSSSISVAPICVSQPTLGAVSIRAPLDGSVFDFGAATPSPVGVRIQWDSLAGGVAAPNNEWIVSHRVQRTDGIGFLASTTVKGTAFTLPVDIPDTVTVNVRPRNCDQPAPSASIGFVVLRK